MLAEQNRSRQVSKLTPVERMTVNEICYNDDVNGDAKLGLADVLYTLKQIEE